MHHRVWWIWPTLHNGGHVVLRSQFAGKNFYWAMEKAKVHFKLEATQLHAELCDPSEIENLPPGVNEKIDPWRQLGSRKTPKTRTHRMPKPADTRALTVSRDATFTAPNMRETLTRLWDTRKPIGAFIGVNPGQADARKDDATARKYIGFAQRWGWGGYVAGNLFEFVATDMRDLIMRIRAGDPVNSPWPDSWLARTNPAVVCLCWGNIPALMVSRMHEATRASYDLDVPIVCAAYTKHGAPAHLSRLGYTPAPIPIPWRSWPGADLDAETGVREGSVERQEFKLETGDQNG